MTDTLLDLKSLHDFYVGVFSAMGVPKAHSRTCANGLLYADRNNIRTHGAASLDRLYLTMLRDGAVDPRATPEVIRAHGATAVVDGGNGLGFVTAEFAMRLAVEKAGEHGIGAVAVRNSSHCGAMGYYSALARERGMIGLASTNLGAQGVLPPPGGRDRLLGTNVLAATAPAGTRAPFALDMSAAVVAAGRIRKARDDGERVPEGWLADGAGRPVTDPEAYFTGAATLRFVGGDPLTGAYKGLGLAMLADVLCGLLSGAAVGPNPANLAGGTPASRKDADIGHFMLAINVPAFRPAGDFTAAMDEMLRVLSESTPVYPDEPVSYPGTPEHRNAELAARDGVRVSTEVLAEMYAVGAELGLLVPRLADAGVVTPGDSR
ncbi:Ldh family oxidoreductase [Lentzea sp.]|uniref:Ldh family oxidoreductase n=1 Tax=Lentzea sp. TaxID=56099 RepID=UPI002CD79B7E|nr:Ldh family oxidoreductase [Lentzea sp.]HUQ56455.1 Ldh family oxidoreductase [Lentzea sp.]